MYKNLLILILVIFFNQCTLLIPSQKDKQDKGEKTREISSLEENLILIPAGEFIMGSEKGHDDEIPVHKVYLDEYWIGKYEVTNKEYSFFLKEGGMSPPYFWDDPQYNSEAQPVVGITWFEAMAYCYWKKKRTAKNYSLPTEAQWEKAARGKDKRTYPWGNEAINEGNIYRANYAADNSWIHRERDGYLATAPVGSYETGKSPFGLYDLAGNVYEWCLDRYQRNYYQNSPYKNPPGPEKGEDRVLKGGSWLNIASALRVSNKVHEAPDEVRENIGFRVVVNVP